MPIEFSCNSCGAAYRVPDRLGGKRARCKHCGQVNEIPPAPAAAQAPPPEASQPSGRVGHPLRGALVIAIPLLLIAAAVVVWRPWRRSVPPPKVYAAYSGHHRAQDIERNATDPGAANYVRCVDNLRRIALALRAYSELNGGRYPASLARLADRKTGVIAPECLICPATGKKIPAGYSGEKLHYWLVRHADYEWLGSGWGPSVGMPPILLHEKWDSVDDDGVNIIDDQLNVRFESVEVVQRILKEQRKEIAARSSH